MSEQSPPDGDRPKPAQREPAGVPPGAPRWVKTLGIVLAALLLLALLVMLASGSQHGPGRHRLAFAEPGVAALASMSLVTETR